VYSVVASSLSCPSSSLIRATMVKAAGFGLQIRAARLSAHLHALALHFTS
jgi:hypothetical protein